MVEVNIMVPETDRKKQTSLSLSPEILSILEDIRDETGMNRSRIVERLIWYALTKGVFDDLGVITNV